MELQQKINHCYIKVLFCLELFKPTLFQRGFLALNCVCRIRTRDTRTLGQSPSELSHMRQVQQMSGIASHVAQFLGRPSIHRHLPFKKADSKTGQIICYKCGQSICS